jgi:hypothetical protein
VTGSRGPHHQGAFEIQTCADSTPGARHRLDLFASLKREPLSTIFSAPPQNCFISITDRINRNHTLSSQKGAD